MLNSKLNNSKSHAKQRTTQNSKLPLTQTIGDYGVLAIAWASKSTGCHTVGFPLVIRCIFVCPPFCLRYTSDIPPIYLRYIFDCSSIPERFPNEARTEDERRMNEGWTKDERESIEERTRTERRAIEKQSRTDRRIKRSITLHYRLVCWITISFHCLDFLGVTVYFSILFTKK